MRNWNREEYSDDRGMKEWNNGGSCITRSFVICIPRKVLTGWSNQNALGNHGREDKCLQTSDRKPEEMKHLKYVALADRIT